jgi:hypothetical protein
VLEQRSAYVAYGAYGAYGAVVTGQRRVCASPCDAVVDGRNGIFTLADELYPAPAPFSFAGMTGDVTLHVEPGSYGRRAAGVTAIVLGALAAATGAVVLPLGQSATVTDANTNVAVNVPNKGVRNAGIGLLVGGVAALAIGIPLVVTGRTTVDIEQRSDAPAKPAARAPRYWMGEF